MLKNIIYKIFFEKTSINFSLIAAVKRCCEFAECLMASSWLLVLLALSCCVYGRQKFEYVLLSLSRLLFYNFIL